MRVVLVCLVIALTCSCRQVTDGPGAENSGATITTRDRVLRILRDDWVRQFIEIDWLPSAQREALRAIKDDYYAEVPRRDSWSNLAIPESTWEIRGPLTMAEARDTYTKRWARYYQKHARWEELRERFEETPGGKDWVRFEGKYRDGDELYYYKSDKRSFQKLRGAAGYVLIRGNSVAGEFVLFQS